MFNYEYGQAAYDLDEIKEKLLTYLTKCCYPEDQNPEIEAKKLFKYLESVVDTIIKRKNIHIRFSSGASPLWHSTIMYYLSKWVAAELKVGKLLAEELDSQLND